MKKVTLYFLSVVLLTGCITTPGAVKTHTSSFDGTQEVTMKPGWVYQDATLGGANFKIGLHWSNSKPEHLSFVATVPRRYVELQNRSGLQFNIDGEIIKLDSHHSITDLDSDQINGITFKKSSKIYSGTVNMLRNILDAKTVKVKLITGDGYMEGLLTNKVPTAAINNMPKFLKKVEKRMSK